MYQNQALPLILICHIELLHPDILLISKAKTLKHK